VATQEVCALFVVLGFVRFLLCFASVAGSLSRSAGPAEGTGRNAVAVSTGGRDERELTEGWGEGDGSGAIR
jgi:hypothetical protein